ncbi:hypothetical protein [Rubrivivax albus]|uniref:hypothetical protein n=1 Tax=Rubrivivax albus TaxID=2499835 RepID=UPI00130546B0|nr:hypothetical protein [Rubrivivax albus]
MIVTLSVHMTDAHTGKIGGAPVVLVFPVLPEKAALTPTTFRGIDTHRRPDQT